jgi:hypothetical protein
MTEYIFRSRLHIDFHIAINGQACIIAPQEVPDCNSHGIPGGLLVPPLVNPEFLNLQHLKQPDRYILDSFDFGRAQFLLLQKIENSRDSSSRPSRTERLSYSSSSMIKQSRECLLDGYPVLLTAGNKASD